MKKLSILLLGIFMFAKTAVAGPDEATTFVSKLANEMIVDVLSTQKPMTEKLDLFRTKFQSAIDLKFVGQFVIGTYWRKATQAERDAFLTAFMDFATKSWADKFNLYNGQKITFTGTRPAQKGQFYVDSTIENNPPAEVIWRVREKNGTYKIVDIVVEGVSMALSYRNEYSSFLQKNNGNLSALTKELEQKSKTFQFSEQK